MLLILFISTLNIGGNMFEVTSGAVELINELIKSSENKTHNITICSSGVGCGGPTLKVEMRTAMEDDIVEIAGGCTFHIRANIYDNLQGAIIEGIDTFWGKRINVKTTYKCI